jgi:hypothetical protein
VRPENREGLSDVQRRTTSVSPTAFAFISTTAQLGDIRLFMRTLHGVLSG